MARILVVEDEKDLAKLISGWLLRDNYVVETAFDGETALRELRANSYDLVILDWMLPELSGIEVCKEYRAHGGTAAIIMLTSKQALDDKEEGFNAGADDYLTKPFQLKELAMRIKALLRRTGSEHHVVFRLYDIEIDVDNHRVTKGSNEIHLLPKEFRLLEFLLRHPQKIFSADELLDSVWEMDSIAHLDTVRGHITRLRKKLDSPGVPSIITTVHGVGYKLGTDNVR